MECTMSRNTRSKFEEELARVEEASQQNELYLADIERAIDRLVRQHR
jgi:hypothetical protein